MKIQDELLHYLHSSPHNICIIRSRTVSRARNLAHVGERRGAYTAILLQTEGKKPLEKRRRRREDNFKVNLKTFDGIVWIRFI